MSQFQAHIKRRDFSEPIALPNLTLNPLRWSWQDVGGPDYAEIAIDGIQNQLWAALQWLRCPVVIYGNGIPVWWGYVADVAFSTDAVDIAVSMADMANKIAVAYSFVDAGTQTVGTRATTAWAEDTISSGEYGVKELLASVDGATTAQAEIVRDRLLAMKKYPAAIPQASGVKNRSLSVGQYSRGGKAVHGAGRLVCLGWWKTLDWRYYGNGGTASTVTTTQISDIITASGAFFTGTDVVDASGVSSSQYRDGDSTALAQIAELPRTPTSGSRRTRATVTTERLLRIETEADSSVSDWIVTPDGIRDRWGGQPAAGTAVIGWSQFRGVVPDSANLGYMSVPSPFYIDENEYDAIENSYRWRARGAPSAWELTRMQQG